jgi:hypothetical protein
VAAVAVAAIAAADLARPGSFSASGSRPAAWLVFAIAWLVGRDLRRRRQRVADLEGRAVRLERERESKRSSQSLRSALGSRASSTM